MRRTSVTPRPPLDASLSPEAFLDYYWLKDEMVAFCRAEGLPTGGLKAEVRDRIAAYLTDGSVRASTPRVARSGAMPDTFTFDTPIGPGWRCTRPLRAFFEAQVGSGFRFNAPVREAIHAGDGRPLRDAVEAWRASRGERFEIAPSLEYNQHTRAYAEAHPSATLDEIREAWEAKRTRPRSEW